MENKYLTRDLYQAAMLHTKGIKMLGLNKSDEICWFIFENKEKCLSLVNDFQFGEILVNARNYAEAIRELKRLVFST